MKIATYLHLDELVAKELGYYLSKGYWYTSNKQFRNYNHMPKFSTDHSATQEIITYLYSEQVALNIWISPELSTVELYKKYGDFYSKPEWESRCGTLHRESDMCYNSSVDSPFNSLPLAICLAFLKYKGIEVELSLHE